MTKAEIVTKITEKTGVEKAAASAAVEEFMKIVKTAITDGDNVYLRGFGSFIVKKRAAKTGRIITKNQSILIPEHYIPAFRPAKSFTDKVKKSHEKKKK